MWTRVWVVVCENYDSTAVAEEERTVRSGGFGLLYLCKSSKDESTVYLTFPLRRTVVLDAGAKREFTLSQPNASGAGPATSMSTLRSTLLGADKTDETKV